jgi:GNAT superfamily N-acetyltransferase
MAGYRVARVSPCNARAVQWLAYLHAKTFPGTDFPLLEGQWWIAFKGREPVGFAGMWKSSTQENTGYMCRSGVLRAHRGNGLQAKMIRARERAARRKGWKWMICDTTDSAASAVNLKRCGYEPFDPPAPWFRKDTVYWRRSLTK